jgi:four helix bundle protein
MDAAELKARTRQFALDVIDVCLTLGTDDFAQIARRQLLRAGTGVAANYRAACWSRSSREFASKLGTVVEEVDESELWLDFLLVKEYGVPEVVRRLQQEAIEFRAILSKSRATTLRKMRERKKRRE